MTVWKSQETPERLPRAMNGITTTILLQDIIAIRDERVASSALNYVIH